MSDVIGRGVIEVSADSTKLNATIAEARARLKSLGDAGKDSAAKASASIDRYIKNLEDQNATLGKSKREIEIYKLALKGASDAQLKAADTALRAREAWEKQQKAIADAAEKHSKAMERIKSGTKTALGALTALAGIAGGLSYEGFQELIKGAGDFQDLAERTGDTAQNLASLAVSAKVGGVEMAEVADASTKLNKKLADTGEEAMVTRSALSQLGINVAQFRTKGAADQMEILGQAFNRFRDSSAKAVVANALFEDSGSKLLPFLKELGQEGGRQVILTEEQIKLADEYADKQAKSRAVIGLHAQALATKLLPEIEKLTGHLVELSKNEDVVSATSTALKTGLWGIVAVFQTFALVGSDVAFTIRTIAREMDGLKRQATALQKLDFKEVARIGKEVSEAAAKDRESLDRFQAGIVALAPADPPFMQDEKPKDKPKGEPDKKDDKADKDKPELKYVKPDVEKQKAKLDSDINLIQRNSEALLTTYQNADRILQARRAANLVQDGDYYEAKAAMIRLDSGEQERALNAQIARYQKEKFQGKDKIENDRKITDAKAKLAKVEADRTTALELNDIDRANSLNKVKQAYLDAATAAQAYIDTIKRQNERIVEGVGKGQKFRDRQDGINGIEDKLISQKTQLDSELRRKEITPEQYAVYLQVAKDTYAEEVRLFNERTDAIDRKNADAFNGMTEALHNYADSARDIAGQTEQAFTNALSGVEDAFVKLASGGKVSFKELLQSIQGDIARMGFRTLIGKGIDKLFDGSSLEKFFGRTAKKDGGAKDAASVLDGLTGAKDGKDGGISQAGQAAALAASKLADLGTAADQAAASLASVGAGRGVPFDASLPGAPRVGAASPVTESMSEAASTAKDQATAQDKAADSANLFGSQAIGAASDLVKLAQSAGVGGEAMARLPGIIGMIQAAATANSASSSGGGIFGAIAKLFGSGGGSAVASSADYAAMDWLAAADGGYIKGPGTGTSDSIPARLSNGEYVMPAKQTAAFLPLLEQMRNDDLRHTGKAGVSAIARIMEESRKSGKEGGTLGAVAGGRAIGGPVSSGGLYRVNERGPELLDVAGKQFLMMGQHDGKVTPTTAGGGGQQPINVNINQTFAPGTDRTTAAQAAIRSGMEARRALARIS